MNVQTLQYSESGGFSAPIGPQLDAERTLVLVFASPEFDQTHNHTMTSTTISERN